MTSHPPFAKCLPQLEMDDQNITRKHGGGGGGGREPPPVEFVAAELLCITTRLHKKEI